MLAEVLMTTLQAAIQGSDPATERIEEMLADGRYKTVIKILAHYKSMPFLELTSVSDIEDEALEKIVRDLEKQDVVKVSNPEDVFEKIITLREKGFSLA